MKSGVIFHDILCSVFIVPGIVFIITSGIGIIRFPDFYVRISAVSKAITLGNTLILIGIGIHFNDIVISAKIVSIIIFMMLTSPLSAHIIARAAIRNKVLFWNPTNLTEFREYLKKQQDCEVESKEEI